MIYRLTSVSSIVKLLESIDRHDMAPIICGDWIDIASCTPKTLTTERSGVRRKYPPMDLPDGETFGLWGFNMGKGDLNPGLLYGERR